MNVTKVSMFCISVFFLGLAIFAWTNERTGLDIKLPLTACIMLPQAYLRIVNLFFGELPTVTTTSVPWSSEKLVRETTEVHS